MSEQVEADYSWLPEKFKSPEEMIASYRALEQKLTAQANELGSLRQLAATAEVEYPGAVTEEQLAGMTEAAPYAAAVMEEVQNSEPAQEQTRLREAASQMDVITFLAEVAQQARTQTNREIAGVVGGVPDPEQVAASVTDQAVGLLQQSHPGFGPESRQESQQLIADELQSNPLAAASAEQALTTNNPAVVATALAGALAAANGRKQALLNQETFSTMKEQSQTISGAGNRPSVPGGDVQEWERIRAAGKREGGY